MINLELPKRLQVGANQARQVATQIFRPISRKYDLAEHEYPVELDTLKAMIEAMEDAGQAAAGATTGRGEESRREGVQNGGNMKSLLNIIETCWGDVGLTLSIPRQHLRNSSLAAMADAEQLE